MALRQGGTRLAGHTYPNLMQAGRRIKQLRIWNKRKSSVKVISHCFFILKECEINSKSINGYKFIKINNLFYEKM